MWSHKWDNGKVYEKSRLPYEMHHHFYVAGSGWQWLEQAERYDPVFAKCIDFKDPLCIIRIRIVRDHAGYGSGQDFPELLDCTGRNSYNRDDVVYLVLFQEIDTGLTESLVFKMFNHRFSHRRWARDDVSSCQKTPKYIDWLPRWIQMYLKFWYQSWL